jgi:hypothetical protein
MAGGGRPGAAVAGQRGPEQSEHPSGLAPSLEYPLRQSFRTAYRFGPSLIEFAHACAFEESTTIVSSSSLAGGPKALVMASGYRLSSGRITSRRSP